MCHVGNWLTRKGGSCQQKMKRKFAFIWGGILLVLLFLCNAVWALPGGRDWKNWANSDLETLQLLKKQHNEVIHSGQVIKDFSQGRLSKAVAAQSLEKISASASIHFSRFLKIEFPTDQNLKACGTDLMRSQLKQIKAASGVLKRDKIDRLDLLALQSGEVNVYRSQNRYFRARSHSVRLLVQNMKAIKQQIDTKRGISKVQYPTTELMEYYQYQNSLLEWQLEELGYAEKLTFALNNLSQGKKANAAIVVGKIKALRQKCAKSVAPSSVSKLKQAYNQELDSFYRFAEAVALIEADKSQDSLSRLYRYSSKLQKDSRAFEEANVVVLQSCLDNI